MKSLIILLLLTISLSASAYEIEPYLSGTQGSYKFENSYKGTISAIGIGGRFGGTLGPLFFGFDAHGQMPWFSEDADATEAQTDLTPVPSFDLWLSMGLAAGIKTRIFSLIYTHFFISDLKAKARNDRSPYQDEKINYKYHGTGSKISGLLHITKNISIGAEIANFVFNKYSIDSATHVISSGKEQKRDELNVMTQSILINYHIPMSVKR